MSGDFKQDIVFVLPSKIRFVRLDGDWSASSPMGTANLFRSLKEFGASGYTVTEQKTNDAVTITLGLVDENNQILDAVPVFAKAFAIRFAKGVAHARAKASTATTMSAVAKRQLTETYEEIVANAWCNIVVPIVAKVDRGLAAFRQDVRSQNLTQKFDEQVAFLFSAALTGDYVSNSRCCVYAILNCRVTTGNGRRVGARFIVCSASHCGIRPQHQSGADCPVRSLAFFGRCHFHVADYDAHTCRKIASAISGRHPRCPSY